jgi:glutamine amidotransferase
MKPTVTVIDLGIGNLGNVRRALVAAGADARVTADMAEVALARRLVLPGVGAFRPPRERLRGALEAALRQALDTGATLLGVCVGYQLLFERGEEFGTCDGLGLLSGRVVRLPESVPLPHIGWNRLARERAHPLLEGIDDGAFVYFVHSFAPEGAAPAATLATALHGRRFAAMSAAGRIGGTQFHPEKSGEAGLRLLANFVAWNGESGREAS